MVNLRPANASDLDLFRCWDEQPHVLVADPNDDWNWAVGLGRTPEQLAMARCFVDIAVTAILVDPLASNTRAHRFYERLGFRWVEARRFGDDDCFVYRLDRADWEYKRDSQ